MTDAYFNGNVVRVSQVSETKVMGYYLFKIYNYDDDDHRWVLKGRVLGENPIDAYERLTHNNFVVMGGSAYNTCLTALAYVQDAFHELEHLELKLNDEELTEQVRECLCRVLETLNRLESKL